jgi:hypothetical protein
LHIKKISAVAYIGGYDDRHGGGRGYGHDSYGGGYDAPQHAAYQPAPAQQPVAVNPSTGQPVSQNNFLFHCPGKCTGTTEKKYAFVSLSSV